MTAQLWVALSLGLPSLVIAFITWWQRNANDVRDQWWKRATWAVDKSLDDKQEARDVGAAALATIYAERTPRGIDSRLDNISPIAIMGTPSKEATLNDHSGQVQCHPTRPRPLQPGCPSKPRHDRG